MCIACAVRGWASSWATFDHDISPVAYDVMYAAATSDGVTTAAASGVWAAGSGVQNVDALISGMRWSGAITYSFPDARSDYSLTYAEADNSFGAVSFNQQQAARYILEGASSSAGGPRMALTAFEQFTNATISDAGYNGADIRIAKSSSANPTAYAYYPSSSHYGGDVWFGTSYDYSNPRVGNYQYATIIHELGHALGLKHGHQLGGVSSVALTADRDSMEFSIMTYRSYVGHAGGGYTNETFGYAQTFMMFDIAALQQMYGADFNTNSGNTTYAWSPTTGETFVNGVGQGQPGSGGGGPANRIFLTVWDGGGTDTYDFSNYTTDLNIDLAPGGWSLLSSIQRANLGNGNYARGNVFNALQHEGDARSLIENAIGGTGHDRIGGNAVANHLRGGAGADIIHGHAGDDLLEGGAGADILNGGLGMDTFIFRASSDGVDRIMDFWSGADAIWLSSAGFLPGATGSLSDVGVDFVLGTAATRTAAALIFDQSSETLYWDPDGSGSTAQVSLAKLSGGSSRRVAGTGDFNSDGSAEILARSTDGGEVGLWKYDLGQFTYSGIGRVPANWEVAGTGDFNGESTTDILWRNAGSGEVGYWSMNGSRYSGYEALPGAAASWRISGTGDFDGEGSGDILWRHSTSGQVLYWQTTNGKYGGYVALAAPDLSWRISATGDFNNDGKTDILWRHSPSGEVGYWPLNGGYDAGYVALAKVSSDWQVSGTGDYDGNGTVDLLWRSTSSGEVGYWVIADNKYAGYTSLRTLSDEIVVGSGELNGDGRHDVIYSGTSSSALSTWLDHNQQTWNLGAPASSDFLFI